MYTSYYFHTAVYVLTSPLRCNQPFNDADTMLAVASLKRSLQFDPVEQGVKRKRAELKLSPSAFPTSIASSPSKQQQPLQPTCTPSSSRKLTFKPSSPSSTSSSTDDLPLFTNSQTAQICARLLREQDQSIREQYEALLKTKVNEQYDTFVRYSHDSVYKKQSKQQQLFHFGQPQDSNNTAAVDFSYVS